MIKIRDKKKAFKHLGIYLLLLMGFFLFLEPNMRGSGGIHEMNTLGKLLGWIMICAGVWGIFRIHPWLMPFRDLLLEHIPVWKLFSFIFFGTAMLSGTMGFITRKSFGIAHVDYISTVFMWLLEGVYAMAGIAGILFTIIEPDKVYRFFRTLGWREPKAGNKPEKMDF